MLKFQKEEIMQYHLTEKQKEYNNLNNKQMKKTKEPTNTLRKKKKEKVRENNKMFKEFPNDVQQANLHSTRQAWRQPINK
jgi:hypothetical protein